MNVAESSTSTTDPTINNEKVEANVPMQADTSMDALTGTPTPLEVTSVPNLDIIKEIRRLVIAGLAKTEATNLQEDTKTASFLIYDGKMHISISYYSGIDTDVNAKIYNVVTTVEYTSAFTSMKVFRDRHTPYSHGGRIITTPQGIATILLESGIFDHPNATQIIYKYDTVIYSSDGSDHVAKGQEAGLIADSDDEQEWLNTAERAGDHGMMILVASAVFAVVVIAYGMYLEATGTTIDYEL